MGQQVIVDTSHARKKLKREIPIQVAEMSDLTNHIANYLSTEDLSSLHSTSKAQSDVVGKNMKYMKYINARCAEETVDGLACNTEKMSIRCTNWCKKNSMRKLYSVFKMISKNGATFKFDNPDEYSISGAEVYGSDTISIRLHDHMYTLQRYNRVMDFSETDSSQRVG